MNKIALAWLVFTGRKWFIEGGRSSPVVHGNHPISARQTEIGQPWAKSSTVKMPLHKSMANDE
jgi:hypothetical protein